MIEFNYEVVFDLAEEAKYAQWLSDVIAAEGYDEGDINYVFCSDDYLYKLNIEFLEHDTLTDIISFDYSVGKKLHGDIFISIERVQENAILYKVDLDLELQRVMVHGILHYCGYKDKTEEDAKVMRQKENFYLQRFATF